MPTTTYGTIPTSTPPSSSSPIDYISRAKHVGRALLSQCRPWRELAHRHAFSLPHHLSDAYHRIRTNASYFAMNYAIIVLLIVFLSLLWHPISLIVFIASMALWLYLYFLRDEPLVILGRPISDKIVLIFLSVLTLVLLLLTNATTEILVSLLVGVVLVVAHAAVRRTDDLSLEEEQVGPAGWYQAVGEAATKGYSYASSS